MKLASFDIEISSSIPEGADWNSLRPLGISCAAVALEGGEIRRWYSADGEDRMSMAACAKMVQELEELTVVDDYVLATWNGCAFDFNVLAEESGEPDAVTSICLNHVDMMLPVVFQKGHFLGLDKVLAGCGLQGKTHEVTLTTGTVLTGMSGAMAPDMWAAGEREAVLVYLDGDVLQTLALAERLRTNKLASWTSNKGRQNNVTIPLQTVANVYSYGYIKPNNGWMTDPPTREQFVEWMPEWARKTVGVLN